MHEKILNIILEENEVTWQAKQNKEEYAKRYSNEAFKIEFKEID